MAGNANSGRKQEKPFFDALRLAINRANGDRKRLDTVASMLIAKAEQGDVQAILAIADRLDGKPVQQIEAHNVNENHYVRAPAKADADDWQKYLDHKDKPEPKYNLQPGGMTEVDSKTLKPKSNGNNGKSH